MSKKREYGAAEAIFERLDDQEYYLLQLAKKLRNTRNKMYEQSRILYRACLYHFGDEQGIEVYLELVAR